MLAALYDRPNVKNNRMLPLLERRIEVIAMTKTLYYRETDPKTGKQKWVKLQGVTCLAKMVIVNRDDWHALSQDSTFIVYKTTRTNQE